MVFESVLISFFYRWLKVFSAPLVKEIVFSPLYIFASFAKDKVSMGAWIYLWAFYFVPLIYISIFVPVPHRLDDCSLPLLYGPILTSIYDYSKIHSFDYGPLSAK